MSFNFEFLLSIFAFVVRAKCFELKKDHEIKEESFLDSYLSELELAESDELDELELELDDELEDEAESDRRPFLFTGFA